ncbi:hypothetical protein Hanom_Chr13g01199791 [Helianthus anomalus]
MYTSLGNTMYPKSRAISMMLFLVIPSRIVPTVEGVEITSPCMFNEYKLHKYDYYTFGL